NRLAKILPIYTRIIFFLQSSSSGSSEPPTTARKQQHPGRGGASTRIQGCNAGRSPDPRCCSRRCDLSSSGSPTARAALMMLFKVATSLGALFGSKMGDAPVVQELGPHH